MVKYSSNFAWDRFSTICELPQIATWDPDHFSEKTLTSFKVFLLSTLRLSFTFLGVDTRNTDRRKKLLGSGAIISYLSWRVWVIIVRKIQSYVCVSGVHGYLGSCLDYVQEYLYMACGWIHDVRLGVV